MINGLSPQGKYMSIHGGTASGPYVNMSNESAGMLRYRNNNLEVYDGHSWLMVTGAVAAVGLNPVAEEAIDWVRRQMEEEKEIENLSKDHPAIKIAYENLNRAKEQLKATLILSKDDQETTT